MGSQKSTGKPCDPEMGQDTELECLVRRVEDHAPNIRNLIHRLEAVLSRLQGPEPCDNCDTEAPQPEGLLGRLDHACSTTDSEIFNLGKSMARLEALV